MLDATFSKALCVALNDFVRLNVAILTCKLNAFLRRLKRRGCTSICLAVFSQRRRSKKRPKRLTRLPAE